MFTVGYLIRIVILIFCIAVLYHDRRQLNGAALLIIGLFVGLLAQSFYDIFVIGNDPIRFTISSIVAGFALAGTLYFHHQRDVLSDARHKAIAAEVARKNAKRLAQHEEIMDKLVNWNSDTDLAQAERTAQLNQEIVYALNASKE